MRLKPKLNKPRQCLHLLLFWPFDRICWNDQRICGLECGLVFDDFLFQGLVLWSEEFAVLAFTCSWRLLACYLWTVLLGGFTDDSFLKVLWHRVRSLHWGLAWDVGGTLWHQVVRQLVDTFLRTDSQIVQATRWLYLVFQLLYFLLLLFQEPSYCVQSFAKVFFIFRWLTRLWGSLVVGFELVLELIILSQKNRVLVMKATDLLLQIRHALLVSLINTIFTFSSKSFDSALLQAWLWVYWSPQVSHHAHITVQWS